MRISKFDHFLEHIRTGAYAWPGGYQKYFSCDDGQPLCFDCAEEMQDSIKSSWEDYPTDRQSSDGWKVIDVDCNYEDDLICCHCNKPIEKAYEE